MHFTGKSGSITSKKNVYYKEQPIEASAKK